MTALLVALGGGLGAMLRYVADRAMTAALLRSRESTRMFPWGILLVNLSGTLLLGVLFGAGVAGPALGAGLLGGFTTFSTASLDTVRMVREKRFRAAAVYAFGTLALAVVLAIVGIAIGAKMSGLAA